MLCKAEFLPGRFRSRVGGEEVRALCWGKGGTVDTVGVESRHGLPLCGIAGGGWAIPGWVGAQRGPARPGRRHRRHRRRRLFPGCRAALGPLSVCWQEAPAHAVLVNIQTRDFSQSKSTSTFFENLPKNSKRREFLAPSPCRRRSKFGTKGVLGRGVLFCFVFSSNRD